MANHSQLANILIDSGLIDQDQLEGFQNRADEQQISILELLITEGVCSDIEVAQTLSIQMGIPLVSLNQLRIPSYIAKMINKDQAERHKAIPISVKTEDGKEVLYIAFLDPTDLLFIRELEQEIKKPVVPVLTTLRDINDAIKRYFRPFRPKKKSKKEKQEASYSTNKNKEIPEVIPEAIEEDDFIIETYENIPEIEAESQEVDLEDTFLSDDGFSGSSFDDLELSEASEESLDFDEDDISEIAALAPKLNMDDLDIDLGLDSNNIPIETPQFDMKLSKKKKASDDSDDDFPDLADEFGSGANDTFSFDESEETEDQSKGANDFLKYNGSDLDKDDGEILQKQIEAEKVHQDVAFSMEDDLDFLDEGTTDNSLTNNESGSHYNLEFGEVANHGSSHQESIDDDDFDGFDFDIPEAPEFSIPPSSNSSSMHVPTLSSTVTETVKEVEIIKPVSPQVDKKQYERPEAVEKELKLNQPEETDWSLDLDELLNDSGQHEVIDDEKVSDFEAAALELDSLLGDDLTSDHDSDNVTKVSLDDDLLDKLDALSANSDSESKDEDLQFLNDFIEGKFDGSNDPGVEKLRNILSSLKRSSTASGQIATPDFMLDLLKENLKK